jgi:hypothetical protein
MKYERNAQPFDPSNQPLSLRTMDLDREMQQVWKMDRHLEHLAIAHRAHELFEVRGCKHGHDWEDWFRAESELHLDE